MALNITQKTNPSNPASQPAPKQATRVNQSSAFSTRAQEVKNRVTGKTPAQGQTTQPQANRPARTDARAAAYAAQGKYPVPPLAQPNSPQQAQTATAKVQPLSNVEPPPSGIAAVRNGTATAPEHANAIPGVTTTVQGATAVAQPTTEAGTTTVTAEAPSDPQVNAQFASLSRKEQAIRRTQQALQAEKAALQQEKANYISKTDITANPLKVLADAGITYDRLVELQVAQSNTDPNQALLLDRIAQLEKQLNATTETVTKTFAERDTLQEQQVLGQIRKDAQLLVDSDPAYETIKATNSVEKVASLIHRVFKEEGEILSVEEAAQAVEEKLLEREYTYFQKMSQLQKIKARLAPQPTAAPQGSEQAEATTQQQQPQRSASQTLTGPGTQQARPMTARDRAIARIKGELL